MKWPTVLVMKKSRYGTLPGFCSDVQIVEAQRLTEGNTPPLSLFCSPSLPITVHYCQ